MQGKSPVQIFQIKQPERSVNSHSKLKDVTLIILKTHLFQKGSRLRNIYEHLKLKNGYHHARFQKSHLESIQGNANSKVFAKMPSVSAFLSSPIHR